MLANAAVLLFPFASYLAAEELHVSGILAVVAAGLYAGRKAPTAVSGRTRLQGNLFWEMAVFLLDRARERKRDQPQGRFLRE